MLHLYPSCTAPTLLACLRAFPDGVFPHVAFHAVVLNQKKNERGKVLRKKGPCRTKCLDEATTHTNPASLAEIDMGNWQSPMQLVDFDQSACYSQNFQFGNNLFCLNLPKKKRKPFILKISSQRATWKMKQRYADAVCSPNQDLSMWYVALCLFIKLKACRGLIFIRTMRKGFKPFAPDLDQAPLCIPSDLGGKVQRGVIQFRTVVGGGKGFNLSWSQSGLGPCTHVILHGRFKHAISIACVVINVPFDPQSLISEFASPATDGTTSFHFLCKQVAKKSKWHLPGGFQFLISTPDITQCL